MAGFLAVRTWQSATAPVATLPVRCGTQPVATLPVGCGTLHAWGQPARRVRHPARVQPARGNLPVGCGYAVECCLYSWSSFQSVSQDLCFRPTLAARWISVKKKNSQIILELDCLLLCCPWCFKPLPSRDRIRNNNPGGLLRSLLSLGPAPHNIDYSRVSREETFCFFET